MTNPEDLCVQQIEEEGVFRAYPVSWALEKYDSGSVAVAIKFAIHEKWEGKEAGWKGPYPPGWFTEHRAWILVKAKDADGNAIAGAEPILSDKTSKRLVDCALWDGDWDKFEQVPPNVFVLVDVASEVYEGSTRFRAEWINPNADEPKARGGMGTPVDRGLLDQLRTKHQAKTRAQAASAGAPGGSPPAPPPAAATPTPSAPVATPQAPPTTTTAAPQTNAPAGPPAGTAGTPGPPSGGPPGPPASTASPPGVPGPPGGGTLSPPAWGAGPATAAPGPPPGAAAPAIPAPTTATTGPPQAAGPIDDNEIPF